LRGSEADGESLFKKTVLLMSSSLILLFIAYELLEAPRRGFVSMKIVDCRGDDYGLHLTLHINNNSSDESRGVLFVMIGYEDSIVSENSTSYVFSRFRVSNQRVLKLPPWGVEMLEINLTPDAGAKRIVIVCLLNPDLENLEGDREQIVARKEEAIWVQTWIS